MRSKQKKISRQRLSRIVLSLCICVGSANIALGISPQNLDDEPDVNTLIENISQGDVEDRLHAFDELESLNWSGKATPAIQVCLSDSNGLIRIKAAELLMKLEQPQVRFVSIAISGLKDTNPQVRTNAAYLLYRFDSDHYHRLIDQVTVSLSDSENEVRRMAAGFLGEAGPDFKAKSVPGLTKLLDDPNSIVRMEAAAALIAVDGPFDDAMRVLIQIIAEANENDTEFHLHGLAYQAIKALGEIGPDAISAVPQLVNSLELGNTFRQWVAAEAMSQIKPRTNAAIKALEMALQNGDAEGFPFVHTSWCASDAAAKALVENGEISVPILLSALSFENDRVRANAAVALGSFPSVANASVPRLIELLKDKNPSVRANAAWGLGLIGPPAKPALKSLVAMLFDETTWSSGPAGGGIATSYSVPWHAVIAIERIEFATENDFGKPDVNTFVESINTGVEENRSINFAVGTVIAKYALALNESERADFSKRLTPTIEELLEQEKFASAAGFALASFNPTHDRVQAVLEESLITKSIDDGSDVIDLVAVRGLELLGSSGRSAIPTLEAAITLIDDGAYAPADELILCSLAILAIDPKNEQAIDSLLKGLDNMYWERDKALVDYAFKKMRSMVVANPYLKSNLINRLSSTVSTPWRDSSPKGLKVFNFQRRLQAAKILVSANLALPETTITLIELCQTGRGGSLADAQAALAKVDPITPPGIETIANSLSDFDAYSIGGDFYGNGGVNFTPSDKAIDALVAIGMPAIDILLERAKENEFHLVRAQAAKAIGLIGGSENELGDSNLRFQIAIQRLVELTSDPSHRVRLEAVQALTKLERARLSASKQNGSAPEAAQQQIREVFDKALHDQRPSIRAAAESGIALKEGPR